VASAETAIDTPMSPAGSVHQSRSRSQGEGGGHSRDRLRDLAALAGASDAGMVVVESLERAGAFASATLSRQQLHDPRSLLTLRVNGADLSLDHGFPARRDRAGRAGVHNTKWVNRVTFR
jgi:DMSO/TMAO reductase YedYZ molybdopterin-dependent catalytic subunit